jgi:UDP-N-acetylmuramoyl-tripeptide--D-alanyl-D-alanine ligase
VKFAAREVATATGGRLVGPEVTVDGGAIDSRGDVAGRLFIPIVAERDGHEFIADALERGATAYMTSREPSGATAIVVDNTGSALSALGAHARDRLPDRVIGITGSVGKTSVKDLAAAALATTFATAASERSFNNELGVPLTLMNAPDGTEAVVVELGARGVGHIRMLCEIARPTIGVVTAVGHVHTELFGTIDDVALGKGELIEALPPTGTAVLNADDERVAGMAKRSSAPVITYGLGAADVTAESIVLDAELRPSFRVVSPWGSAQVALSVRGHHQVANTLAALAAAGAAGVRLDDAVTGVADATLSPWRMELHHTASGAVVLNDAYNANPISMAAALRALAAVQARRRVAVVGTMAELGAVADEEHRAIADLAASLGVRMIAVDERRYTGAEQVSDMDAALAALGELGVGDAVLVKGSRVAGLERLAGRLVSDR